MEVVVRGRFGPGRAILPPLLPSVTEVAVPALQAPAPYVDMVLADIIRIICLQYAGSINLHVQSRSPCLATTLSHLSSTRPAFHLVCARHVVHLQMPCKALFSSAHTL